MKLGTVIGRITLGKAAPELDGARWLLVSPLNREHFALTYEPSSIRIGSDPSPVVYDDLGGSVGQTIGYVEGREAAAPFAAPIPIDAINAALIDEIFYSPMP